MTVDYTGSLIAPTSGMQITKNIDGHAVIVINTEELSVTDAIINISKQSEIKDISISGATAEEMVVGLYKEFQI